MGTTSPIPGRVQALTAGKADTTAALAAAADALTATYRALSALADRIGVPPQPEPETGAGGELEQEPDDDHDAAVLLTYSEWLDGQGLVVGDGSPATDPVPRKAPGEDPRSHQQLVAAFLAGRGGRG